MNYIIKSGGVILGVYASMADAANETELVGDILVVTNEELENSQREWRNQELKKSDWIVPISDHPERASYLTYRASLRNWPSTDDFPNIKPIL